jgi:hypothetical protein
VAASADPSNRLAQARSCWLRRRSDLPFIEQNGPDARVTPRIWAIFTAL